MKIVKQITDKIVVAQEGNDEFLCRLESDKDIVVLKFLGSKLEN